MTAFEMAGALTRQMSGRNYTRDNIKIAHNNAVEQLVRNYCNLFREPKSIPKKRSKLVSKKESRASWGTSLQMPFTKRIKVLFCKVLLKGKQKKFKSENSQKSKKLSPNQTANKPLNLM